MTMIGIDLGGSNLRAATIEGDAKLATHLRQPVGEPRDPDTIVERCARVVEELAGGQPSSVGIGIAAMLRDRQGTVANSPHLRWRDTPFGALLARRLGSRFKVGVYNDVNAIVYGEGVAGAARGCRDVLGVYVGTGIGAGLIVNGQLVEGASNCAGEIGHTKVRWDGDAVPCACGGRGCVEAYVGGHSVQRRIRGELAGGAPSSALVIAGGRVDDVTPGHVDEAAAAGDPWALELWAELAPLLGVSLANAVAVLNPNRLVLGGGMLSRTPVLREQVVASLLVAAPAALLEPLQIVDGALGDDAGLVGAALLALRGINAIQGQG